MEKTVYEFNKIYNLISSHNIKDGHYIFQDIKERKLTDIYHSHTFYEFIIISEGECRTIINDEEFDLVKNDIVFLTPGDSHSFLSQSEDVHIISFSVETDEVRDACSFYGKSEEECFGFKISPLIFSQPGIQSIVRAVCSGILIEAKEYEFKFLLSYLLKILAVKSAEKDGDDCPAVIVNALREMKKRENLKKGVPAFVEAAGYSRPQLLRLLKKYFNMTLHEYVTEQRLETAYSDLILTRKRPEDIAEELGFKSFSHFGKIFKSNYGMTPAELRKQKGLWTV